MYNFYIIEFIINFTGVLQLVYFFNKTMNAKHEEHSNLYTILMIILYTIIQFLCINDLSTMPVYIKLSMSIVGYYMLVLIYPILTRRGSFGEVVFLSTFYISIMSLIVVVINLLILIFFDINLFGISTYEYISYEHVIFNILLRIIKVIVTFIFANNMYFIKRTINHILYSISAISIFNHILLIIAVNYIVIDVSKYSINLIIIIIALLLIQVTSIYILNKFYKEMEEKLMLKISLKEKKYEKEVIEVYKEMRGWKHDFRNHINIILGLLENDSKDEAIKYIEDIDSRISKFERYTYTDNITIDSILSSKVKTSEENNIKLDIKVNIKSEIKVPNIEMCIILGNLIDNSIEACKKISGHRFIDLEIISDESRLIIKITNNTNGEVNKINGKFFTTKREGLHGIGLLQIDDIVEKYDGYINRKHEDNIFATYIMIQYQNNN